MNVTLTMPPLTLLKNSFHLFSGHLHTLLTYTTWEREHVVRQGTLGSHSMLSTVQTVYVSLSVCLYAMYARECAEHGNRDHVNSKSLWEMRFRGTMVHAPENPLICGVRSCQTRTFMKRTFLLITGLPNEFGHSDDKPIVNTAYQKESKWNKTYWKSWFKWANIYTVNKKDK